MKDKLEAIPIEQATVKDIMSVVEIMSEQKANNKLRKEGHRCWMFVPSLTEWEKMKRFVENDTCPQCGKGRVILDIYHGNIGSSIHLVCRWQGSGCGFKEYISDPE